MIEIALLIEIVAFHGTSLLLIILLSLKAESKSVLHSSDFQSYSLSHNCTPFAPPRITPSPNPIGHLSSSSSSASSKSNIHHNQTAFATV